VVTLDSIQGGQNHVIVLDITAANEHHGSLLGFIAKWNRMNVGITRAMKVLSIFGNIDLWRTELYNIVMINKSRKFGYFMVDVLDGDTIDVTPVSVDRLPADQEEFFQSSDTWSLVMPHMDRAECQLSSRKATMAAKNYKADAKGREKFEKGLHNSLQDLLRERDELERKFKAGEHVETALFHKVEGEGHEIDVESDDDGMDVALDNLFSEAVEGPKVDDDMGLNEPTATQDNPPQEPAIIDQDKDAAMSGTNDQGSHPMEPTAKDTRSMDADNMAVDVNDPDLIEQQHEIEAQLQHEAHQAFLERAAAKEAEEDRLEEEDELANRAQASMNLDDQTVAQRKLDPRTKEKLRQERQTRGLGMSAAPSHMTESDKPARDPRVVLPDRTDPKSIAPPPMGHYTSPAAYNQIPGEQLPHPTSTLRQPARQSRPNAPTEKPKRKSRKTKTDRDMSGNWRNGPGGGGGAGTVS
jgi:hypothetical protein